MNNLLNNVVIRKIKAEDADEISRIDATITKSPDRTDFRQIIEEQVRKDELDIERIEVFEVTRPGG